MPAPIDLDTLPAILYDEQICEVLDISRRTLKRLRRGAGAFPIPELPKLDRKRRYSRADVVAYVNRTAEVPRMRKRAG